MSKPVTQGDSPFVLLKVVGIRLKLLAWTTQENRPPVSVFLALVMAVLVLSSGCGDTVTRAATGDLNGDGELEQYRLAGGCLTVSAGNTVLWESPAAWRVDGFALGDVTHDGVENLVLSLWKKGSYGPRRPFWETGADRSYKNHLFVYRLGDDDTLRQEWCSSNLDRPIVSLKIRDADGDGLNELVVEEGAYRRVIGERYALDEEAPLRTIVLQWDGWGFRLCAPELNLRGDVHNGLF